MHHGSSSWLYFPIKEPNIYNIVVHPLHWPRRIMNGTFTYGNLEGPNQPPTSQLCGDLMLWNKDHSSVQNTHAHNFAVLILSPQIVRRFLLTKDWQDAVGCRFKPAPIKTDLLTSHQMKQSLLNWWTFVLLSWITPPLRKQDALKVLFNWRKCLFNVKFTLVAFKQIKLECNLVQH